MVEYSEAFVAFDVSKTKHAVAIADGGRGGEVRFLGEVSSSPAAVKRLVRKLSGRYDKLHFCYEAGPTGYGLYRQIQALAHTCLVVAPALIPKRPGERVKTNRRDAVTLARLHRAGELTGVWVPDAAHEAVRDLVRAREAAADDLRRKRQQLLSFLLRHGRVFSGAGHWTLAPALAAKQSSSMPHSRSSFRRPSMRSRTPCSVCAAWSSSWPSRCRAGRWRRW
jgi:transposase